MAVVVLVNAYSSLLISYLTIPTLKPVAKSFDDVTFRNVQGLKPLVEKNNVANNMITVSVFKKKTSDKLIFSIKRYYIAIWSNRIKASQLPRYKSELSYSPSISKSTLKESLPLLNKDLICCTPETLLMVM